MRKSGSAAVAGRTIFFSSRMSHLVSYLTVGLLPLLLCIALLAVNNVAEQKRQIDAQVAYGLRQFNNTYLSSMEDMETCASHLAERLEEGMSRAELPAQLLSYERNYPQFSAVLYFEKTSNRIYTSAGELPYADFERTMRADYGINLTSLAFYKTLCQASENGAIVGGASDETGSEPYLFYFKTLPKLNPAPKAVVAFMLPVSEVVGDLDEYVPEGYSIYSYSDAYLTWLIQRGGEAAQPLQEQMNMLRSDSPYHARIDGVDYLLLRVKSALDGMYHMIAYREDVLYRPLMEQAARATLPVLATLALAAAAAVALHRYFYRGVEQMLALPFPPDAAAGMEPGRDPYAYLLANTRGVIDQNRRMIADIRRYNVAQMLKGLLHGNVEDAACAPNFAGGLTFQALMPQARFTVAYVREARFPDGWSRRGYASEEMPRGCGALWMIPACGGVSAAILGNHADCAPEEFCRCVADFLAREGVGYAAVGVGCAQTDAGAVQISLMQAQIASLDARGGVRLYSSDESCAKVESLMPIAEKDQICRAIMAGDSVEALSAFGRLLVKLQSVALSDRVSHEWYLFVLEAILGALRDGLYPSIVSEWNVDRMISLYGAGRDEKFRSFIVQMCDEVRELRDRKSEALQNQVVAYVAEHALDESLTPARLAEAFQIAENAAALIVKESTGMSFAKYVALCKMEYVCRELRETDRPIKEIVASAGYLDVSNFTRKFRLQYGCTPSAYRENARRAAMEG